ncbi:MAG: hypothetical protein K8T10_05125 [Candidatus Eremiobacteraeota bacterium]|nr:hypothetical protein [Candidatus Eremiobacteraeota bacterium]
MSRKKKKQSKKNSNILLRFIDNPGGEIILQGNRSGLVYFAGEVRKMAASKFSEKKLKLTPGNELSDDSSHTIIFKKLKKDIRKEIAGHPDDKEKAPVDVEKKPESISEELEIVTEKPEDVKESYLFEGEPEEIFAIQFVVCGTGETSLTPGRLYRVEQLCSFLGDNTQGEVNIPCAERKYSFFINNDRGEEIGVDLCLEDKRINFFSKDELMRLYR